MVTHQTMLWTNLHTGHIQRRCICGMWETDEVLDTPENRRILVARARDHIQEQEVSNAGQAEDKQRA